jgi:hypothetical protein
LETLGQPGPLGDGRGNIHDDGAVLLVFLGWGMEFVFDGGEGAEEQVAGVGHDGGAAGRDAAFGLMKQEAGQEVVDGGGGFEFRNSLGEKSGEIGGPAEIDGGTGMLGAEGGRRVRDEHAAAAVASMLLAAGKFVDSV